MMRRLIFLFVTAWAILLAGCDSSSSTSVHSGVEAKVVEKKQALPEVVSFNEHIQPILSEYCYHCHGPDAKTRAPKDEPLRLDRAEDAFALRADGHPVIVKGKAAESALLKRIHSKDAEEVMPPPESHKVLDAKQIALIERWIEQGAVYEPHWAFAPVKRTEPPVDASGWSINPVDKFVAAKLNEKSLTPNKADDPRRFHRRLVLDLTGLPPRSEETDAFVAAYQKAGQQAVEAEADRLMGTTECAEQFARQWLDVARYADTHGIHIDNYRAIWPYRDWVVRAFKANKPWDQFTTEQIAGDLLPNRTLEQLIATGFNRCMATTGEGGAISEEYEAIYAKDQVETVSAGWLGLTTGCATCHDHKFDPISTQEFYSMTAFFRNTTMSAMDGNNANHPPSVFIAAVDDRERWVQLQAKIAESDKVIQARAKEAEPAFKEWLAKAEMEPYQAGDKSLELYLPLAEAEGPLKGRVNGEERSWPVEAKRVDGLIGKALMIDGQSIALGDVAKFSRQSLVTLSTYIRIEGKPNGVVIARMDPTKGNRGWSLELEDGRPVLHMVDAWEDAESRMVAEKELKPGEWHHFVATFDGAASGHQAITFKLDGKRFAGKTYPNTVGGSIEADVPLRLGSREGGVSQLKGSVAIQDLRIYRRLLNQGETQALAGTQDILKAIRTEAAKRTPEQIKLLRDYFLKNIDEPSQALQQDFEKMKSDERDMQSRGSMTLVMEEKKQEPFAHVLRRGVYTDKAEKVSAGTLSVLPPMPAGAPKNRLGLAQWLNDPSNPLPARVVMNRAWSYFFGIGIVETSSDFGIMGARPSHPKLLDWLAAEFVDSKWDYRHMVKLIVTSATYRQSGDVTPEKLEKDPTNALLSRGPRYRLDAEQIRDLALSVSGLLSNKVGGPPVKPYQPDGIWEAVAMPQSNTKNYVKDRGEGLYRRSLYTMWKRTAPPPSMEILNAPSRESFCVRRDRTNTPLQALVLLNDPQFVEASRELAAVAIRHASDINERLDLITLRLCSRVFDDKEREIVRRSYDAALAEYRKHPELATQLVSTGESPCPKDLDVSELAAWTLVTSQVLNLDETITR